MAMNEADVIEAIRNNRNDKALRFLYDSLLPDIKKHIRSNNGNNDDAEDIFQDALVILFRYIKLGQYDEKYSLGGFMTTVCKNLWINKAKKDKRNIRLDKITEMPDIVNAHEDLISEEREKEVSDAMSKIGQKCQELLILANFEKLPMKEIAEKLGLKNEDTAKTQKYKCMQRLIAIIKNNPALMNKTPG